MAKILFINPPTPTGTCAKYFARSADRWPHTEKGKLLIYPIFMAYAAAVLEEKGFSVKVIDAVAEELQPNELISNSSKIDPDLVIMETSTPSIKSDLNTAKLLKARLGMPIVFIGPHATVFATEILQEHPYVDMIARGEYDFTLSEVAESVERGADLHHVQGITYRNDSKVIKNPDRNLIQNLDELPYPARHLIPPNRYVMAHFTFTPFLLMISSRGCPYRCTFCLWPKTMYGYKFRARSPEKVVDEMEYLINEFRAREIYFHDDTFTLGKKRVLEICREVNKRKLDISWSCLGRVDNCDKELLSEMTKAGCVKILFGVESGSQEILNKCKKGITIEQVKNTFHLTKNAGIKTHATFMFGLPGETRETVRKTIEFAKELDPDTIQFSIAIPYPGTEFYEQVKADGTLISNDFSDFDGSSGSVVEYEDIRRTEFVDIRTKAIIEYYTRPKILSKEILRMRSYEDIKRLLSSLRIYLKMRFRE